MDNQINSLHSKTIIETLQDEKANLLSRKNQLGYVNMARDIDYYIKNICKDTELAETKINRKIGEGSSAIVYETEDGDVLKLTRNNHFPLRRPHEDFDVPIKKQGKSGKVYYYFEEKLYQHNLNTGFVNQIKDMIAKKGYKTWDLGGYGIHQIGLSESGQLYLLDPECARYKNIFHACWQKLKKII